MEKEYLHKYKRCPKCGVSLDDLFFIATDYYRGSTLANEHMKCRCVSCGFSWREEPICKDGEDDSEFRRE